MIETSKKFIIGADECGYGSLAGEIVVCGVKALKDWSFEGLNDSKKLSPKKRTSLTDSLSKNKDIQYHIALRDNVYIDKIGVFSALKECYVEIFNALYCEDSLIIIDGNMKFDNLSIDHMEKISLIKADTLIPHVMAASIIGKTNHDLKMTEVHHVNYPQYHFNSNMGYGSPKHKEAIKIHGLSDIHRKSYKIK